MQSQLAVWQHPTGIFSAFSQFGPSRTTWIRIFNFRATTLLAVNQHPVRVLVALACLGPVWALIFMSTAISTHWLVLAQYRHWFSCPLLSLHTRPRIVGFGITGGRGVVLDVVVPMRKNDFSTFLLCIKPRTRVPLIRILQYRNSDPNFPSIP